MVVFPLAILLMACCRKVIVGASKECTVWRESSEGDILDEQGRAELGRKLWEGNVEGESGGSFGRKFRTRFNERSLSITIFRHKPMKIIADRYLGFWLVIQVTTFYTECI